MAEGRSSTSCRKLWKKWCRVLVSCSTRVDNKSCSDELAMSDGYAGKESYLQTFDVVIFELEKLTNHITEPPKTGRETRVTCWPPGTGSGETPVKSRGNLFSSSSTTPNLLMDIEERNGVVNTEFLAMELTESGKISCSTCREKRCSLHSNWNTSYIQGRYLIGITKCICHVYPGVFSIH